MKVNYLFRQIYSRNTLKKLKKKIEQLGVNSKLDINVYLSFKTILLLVVFLGILLLSRIGYFLAPLVTVLLYLVYDYLLLDSKIKRRSKVLEHDAIFFFEVLSLALQSESNLQICLQITSNSIDSELSLEFKKMLEEIALGKSFTEGLENLKERIPSKNVNNVILSLIEASLYGNNINSSLENQIQYLNEKRILEIKGEINKMPLKISVVSVIFMIPLILLLILGPIVINFFVK